MKLSRHAAAKLGLPVDPQRRRRQADASHAKPIDTTVCQFFGRGCSVTIHLPIPPSANVYWRHWRGKTTISADGKAYRQALIGFLHDAYSFGPARLRMVVTLHAPDLRRRDLGNLEKCLLDSLKHAGMYDDDSQIDDLRFVRGLTRKPGIVVVTIEKIPS